MLSILRITLIKLWLSSLGVFPTVMGCPIILYDLPLLLLLFAAYILIPYEIGV